MKNTRNSDSYASNPTTHRQTTLNDWQDGELNEYRACCYCNDRDTCEKYRTYDIPEDTPCYQKPDNICKNCARVEEWMTHFDDDLWGWCTIDNGCYTRHVTEQHTPSCKSLTPKRLTPKHLHP